MARYYADQALGMLETIGMVPALEACDKMLKAAEVDLLSYENVGSTGNDVHQGRCCCCKVSIKQVQKPQKPSVH